MANTLAKPLAQLVERHSVIVEKGALAASDAAAGVFSWQNSTGLDVFVTRVVIEVITASTGACTIDAGQSATAASSDNLLDGLNVNATGESDNVQQSGTNGDKVGKRVADGEYVTASKATGAAAGLVGNYFIFYVPVP